MSGCNSMVGDYVVVRTDRAGVFFGKILEKAGGEIILGEARRLWYWKAAKSISLSGVAVYGIDVKASVIAAPVDRIWLQPIELLAVTEVAADSIRSAPEAQAK